MRWARGPARAAAEQHQVLLLQASGKQRGSETASPRPLCGAPSRQSQQPHAGLRPSGCGAQGPWAPRKVPPEVFAAAAWSLCQSWRWVSYHCCRPGTLERRDRRSGPSSRGRNRRPAAESQSPLQLCSRACPAQLTGAMTTHVLLSRCLIPSRPTLLQPQRPGQQSHPPHVAPDEDATVQTP